MAALASGIAATAGQQPRQTHPNVVIILVDDMGYGDPGCFNPESRISTPNIDGLAVAGMKFLDAHAPGPLCHLSRYGLLTGRYPFRTDVTRWPTEPVIEDGQETLATLAKRAGYHTAIVGKWHLGFKERGYDQPLHGGPVDHGFETFFGMRASTDIPPYFYIRGDRAVEVPTDSVEDEFSPDWSPIQGRRRLGGKIAPGMQLDQTLPRFTDEAIAVIREHGKSGRQGPLLLYLAYPAPHTPWLPSAEHRGQSDAGLYGDFAEMVDSEIGRVTSELKDSGIWDDTLIVFASDNGPCWSEKDVQRFGHDSAGGLRGMKGDAWEAGHRMPFIVSWPRVVEPGSSTEQTVCFTDLLATFASIVGEKLDDQIAVDSYNLLPVLLGFHPDERPIRPPVVTQAGSAPEMFAIRGGKWKLITGLGSGGFSKPKRIAQDSDGPSGQLYDLDADLREERNLYAERPGVVERAVEALNLTRAQPTPRTSLIPGAVDASGLDRKVMCGYQAWFNTPDDGSALGWKHWARRAGDRFGPGNATVDLWPDVSELDADERFATGFTLADGTPAEVYSSVHPKTVLRHFGWMQEHGIDGVFLQRFANGLNEGPVLENKNSALRSVRGAALATGRVYAVMYDLSGLRAGETQRVYRDWERLSEEERLTSDSQYLSHNGKPLVAVWGIGFHDGGKPRDYSLEECRTLVSRLKQSGCAVMLGVPTGWRTLSRDSVKDAALHEIILMADVVSPWTPGRYRDRNGVREHARNWWQPDVEWCEKHEVDYLPVVFPGFSWHNLTGAKLAEIPREGGRFLWSQFVAAKKAGASMAYVAMFDEVDEGTAIFKCTNNPPVGEGVDFLTYEGLPTDHYLWLTGEAGRMFRDEQPASARLPVRER
ncbi:sulfatase-like hydrolase/transferase [Posidoniimonas polymericola]|uniref:sulfatase-like hydrolase/transferase n=1 Tax=Posidoniimonas polymericola TaxID=2528002 RepID=UPI001E41EB7F|nr:sulfatase-like hydrolase/transferase [Posidoniimonas polymericola]